MSFVVLSFEPSTMNRPGEQLLSTLMEPWMSYGGRLKVSLFPNPAKDFLNVKVKVSRPFHKGGVLTIYDEDDLKKLVVFIQLGENRVEIQDLEPGTYSVRIDWEEEEKWLRFVKH